ncbi:hypothetical protein F4604DRAFT_1906934 [Suillus subluteus]|nr:hypothetical protein F4604DRAFT_1906934 [Suillus subluteus]
MPASASSPRPDGKVLLLIVSRKRDTEGVQFRDLVGTLISIERDCSGAGIFLAPDVIEGGELGGVHGSDEVKAEVEYDFLIGEVVVVVDEPDDMEKKEDEEVDEFDDDLVEVHAKEMFEAPNILFSGSGRVTRTGVAFEFINHTSSFNFHASSESFTHANVPPLILFAHPTTRFCRHAVIRLEKAKHNFHVWLCGGLDNKTDTPALIYPFV